MRVVVNDFGMVLVSNLYHKQQTFADFSHISLGLRFEPMALWSTETSVSPLHLIHYSYYSLLFHEAGAYFDTGQRLCYHTAKNNKRQMTKMWFNLINCLSRWYSCGETLFGWSYYNYYKCVGHYTILLLAY